MPPPTPSATFIASLCGGNFFLPLHGRIVVLHQPPPDFFHRRNRRLLGSGGQEAPRAVLQLARPLGDDDETISARFRIVRNNTRGGLSEIRLRHSSRLLLRNSLKSDGSPSPSSRAGCGLLRRSPPACPRSPSPGDSPARNRTTYNSESLRPRRAIASRSLHRNLATGHAAAALKSRGWARE